MLGMPFNREVRERRGGWVRGRRGGGVRGIRGRGEKEGGKEEGEMRREGDKASFSLLQSPYRDYTFNRLSHFFSLASYLIFQTSNCEENL